MLTKSNPPRSQQADQAVIQNVARMLQRFPEHGAVFAVIGEPDADSANSVHVQIGTMGCSVGHFVALATQLVADAYHAISETDVVDAKLKASIETAHRALGGLTQKSSSRVGHA